MRVADFHATLWPCIIDLSKDVLVHSWVVDEQMQRFKTTLVLSFPLVWCVFLYMLRLHVVKTLYHD